MPPCANCSETTYRLAYAEVSLLALWMSTQALRSHAAGAVITTRN